MTQKKQNKKKTNKQKKNTPSFLIEIWFLGRSIIEPVDLGIVIYLFTFFLFLVCIKV